MQAKCEENGLSVSATTGIILLLAMPVGVVIGLDVEWYNVSHVQGPTRGQQSVISCRKPLETAIPLRDNQSYGHLDIQRNN